MGGGFGLFGKGRFDGCGGCGGGCGGGGWGGWGGWGGGCGCGREREACCVTAVRACKIKGGGFDGWW
ncbi:hypothetical protein MSKOL_2182 [Methanosarcina sp. Kolksee]|uniref:hypothetical protein n=1 Tax=Methanosarcina sp. Kolksee TaxID=1434099 RepID=UPI000615DEED|nr:hypothetical protein [Methanosarcina sp. Kolksee]AKB47959.1 hypothetical protein MSKOL_2182 [Methanosarcina sp. Kolksee]